MITLLKNTVFYVIGYLLLMIPTYVLPYFGSNSWVANGLGAALGRGPMPQWWLHAWALVMLVLVVHLRGKLVGKHYLIVFPLVAAVFDMVPGLSAIPLVPTVMHLLAIVLGVITPALERGNEMQAEPSPRRSLIVAGLMTVATFAGSAWFTFNIAGGGAQVSEILTNKSEQTSASPKSAPVKTQSPPSQVPALVAAPSLDSQEVEQQIAVKPLHKKPIVKTITKTEPVAEPAPAPKVRYINLNDS